MNAQPRGEGGHSTIVRNDLFSFLIVHGLRVGTETWSKVTIDAWTGRAGIVDGHVFRTVSHKIA